jgi:hypothetical protein
LTDEPFVGLRAMDESWANRFFGRKAEVRELVEKFKKHRLVAIVADSGAGKSADVPIEISGFSLADKANQTIGLNKTALLQSGVIISFK